MKTVWFILRLAFGAFFLWSGVAKLKDPILFAEAVRNFRIVGDPVAPALALFIPWLEIVAGFAVMTDRFARGGAAVLTTAVIAFTGAVVAGWARGLDITCGCFGGTGELDYPVKIAENAGLIALGVALWWRETRQAKAGRAEPGGAPLEQGVG